MISEKGLLKIINKKNQGRFSKRIVSLIIFLNVVFTAAVLYVFLKVGSEPTTLVISWFGFTTGELAFLFGIKRKKIKEDDLIG